MSETYQGPLNNEWNFKHWSADVDNNDVSAFSSAFLHLILKSETYLSHGADIFSNLIFQFSSNFVKKRIFSSLEVVDRSSEVQLQVTEIVFYSSDLYGVFRRQILTSKVCICFLSVRF